MKHSLFIGLLIALIAGLFVMSSSSAGVDDKEKLADEFANKIVTIYLRGPQEGEGQIIENVEFKKIGGQLMVVGTGADTGQNANWTVGLRVGLRWDLVKSYYAMTEEEFEEKVKNRK